MPNDTVLLFGKIGIYSTDPEFSYYSCKNRGFKKGIDNRAISSLVYYKGSLYAGSLMGLFHLPALDGSWQEVEIPVKNKRITDITIKDDTLIVLTRDYLLKSVTGKQFDKIQLPQPVHYKRESSMFRFLWTLHSGELFGVFGKLFVDLLGIVVVILSLTGLFYFVFPKLGEKIISDRKKVRRLNRMNLRWHNVLGYVFGLFLLVNTIAGMFLRPPLLIPIAGAAMPIVPFTHLDNPNPWQDKLRMIRWNEFLNTYIVSTSDGFYVVDEGLGTPLKPVESQPPVSVMGCNVFEPVADDTYLIGSFSGLFSWNVTTGYVFNMMTNQAVSKRVKSGRPVSDYMVSGLVRFSNKKMWYLDYSKGIQGLVRFHQKAIMPGSIKKNSPMSLWNFCLELHTGRIFESILGPFYILYIPVAGICFMLVLVSGFFLWWWIYRQS